jgi:hypothetical protein
MLEHDYQLQEHHEREQETAQQSLRLDGSTDAAFGDSPKSKDPVYVDAYLAEIKRRILDGDNLTIRWLSPTYLSGAFDAPEWFQRGEEF